MLELNILFIKEIGIDVLIDVKGLLFIDVVNFLSYWVVVGVFVKFC